jgi:lipopolysaccharide heptosyltransferase II
MLRRWRSRREREFSEFVAQRSRVRKILVLRNGLIGDVVFITPVLQRLRQTFPDAVLDVMVSERAVEVVQSFPSVRTIRLLPENASLMDQIRIFRDLRIERYDLLVIQETNSHYSAMSFLAGAQFCVGFENSLDVLLDKAVPWRENVHAVSAEMDTVLGWTADNPRDPVALHLSTTSEEKKQAELVLRQYSINPQKCIVCFHPGCSDARSVREWIVPRYSEVADRCVEMHNAQIVFTGLARDGEMIEAIRKCMKSPSANLAGKTPLRLFMAILECAGVVIGSDTGALHIATALGTPVVMLMGFTGPDDTGPFDASHRSRVVRVELPCSPCIHQNPKPLQWETCKNIRPVLCMDRITSEAVFTAVKEVVETPIPAERRKNGNRH